MQVPEKLALIGGSILLASTLVFTLRSQASRILPRINGTTSQIYDHIGDAKDSSAFNEGFQRAQQKGWKTGYWGTAPYYIDDQQDMYVGSGELQSGVTLRSILGDGPTDVLHSLNIVQSVQAPSDSSNLFSTSDGFADNHSDLEQINGLEHVDTSQVTNMRNMFTNGSKLEHINGIENWDTSQVTNMAVMFNQDSSLQDINVAHWDVDNVQDMGYMFKSDTSLNTLDLSGWNDAQLPNPNIQYGHGFWGMLDNANIQKLVLGDKTRAGTNSLLASNWQNGDQVLSNHQLEDYNFHPGTWIRQ